MIKARIVAVVVTVLVLVGLSPPPPARAALDDSAYERINYDIRELPRERWPYYSAAPSALDGTNTYDDEGVSVRVIGGKPYDHPVLQAQFMLTRLGSYYHNEDPDYLARVEAHAGRLIDNAVYSRGGMYLPYPFDWALHGDRSDMMVAPWYSAMAQGQALSAFVRLYEVTGNPLYRGVADQLFASFLNLKSDGVPWTVNIDDDGYLWFEEYAKDVGADRSVNGHIFATYGLYDYWRLTGSREAELLFEGGVTAIEGHMDEIRNTGWISRYSLENTEYLYASYHIVHVGQLYQLYNMTGAASLALAADRLIEDFPASQHGGRGYLAAGTHRALIVDGGVPTGTREVTLPSAEAVTMTSRQRLEGQPGIWLKVGTGTLSGMWLREEADRVFVKLGIERYHFHFPRLVRFAQGTYEGFRFDNLGLRASSKRFTLTRNSGAHMNERVVMNGVTYYRILNGVWKDYWVPAQPGVTTH